MKHPEELHAIIRSYYKKNWRDQLLTPRTEPIKLSLGAPSNTAAHNDAPAVSKWMRAWGEWIRTRDHLCELETRRLGDKYGAQLFYTHVVFSSFDGLAQIDSDDATHWAKAQQISRRFRLESAAGKSRIKPHLNRLVDLVDGDVLILAAATDWFRANPRSGLTLKRVPIEGMHTKWLKSYQRLVLALLDVDTAPVDTDIRGDHEGEPDELTAAELDALGLIPPPPELDVVLLDPQLRQAAGGLRTLRAPVQELANLPIEPQAVLIAENKDIPLDDDIPGLLLIRGLGNNLQHLQLLPWLAQAPTTLYWGDLDRHGLTLLSRARQILPGLRSVMMDQDTCNEFAHLSNTETADRHDPPQDTLDEEEQELYRHLSCASDGRYPRLEQERIPADFARSRLAHALRIIPAMPSQDLCDKASEHMSRYEGPITGVDVVAGTDATRSQLRRLIGEQ